jgi:isoleucyl-tRNA synthetase
VSLYSTKLETPISNFEVAMDDSYSEINDPAITVSFRLKDVSDKLFADVGGDISFLAWTTTPWTIPTNIALGVNKDLAYALVHVGDRYYVVAQARVGDVFKGMDHTIVRTFPGVNLV